MKETVAVGIYEIENRCNEAIKAMRNGNIYVCRFFDGVCFFANKESKELMGIIYDPDSCETTRIQIDEAYFIDMYNTVFKKDGNKHYEVKDNRHNLIKEFKSISKALGALTTGRYKDYMVKQRYKLNSDIGVSIISK